MHRDRRERKTDIIKDKTPHKVKPPVGFFKADGAASGSCTKCEVCIAIEHTSAKTTISSSFARVDPDARLFFPVSEFGRAATCTLLFNGDEVRGERLRRGENNMTWLKEGDLGFEEASTLNPSYTAVFCLRTDTVVEMNRRIPSVVVNVSFVVRTSLLPGAKDVLDYALPYTCCPRPPTAIEFKVRMLSTIRYISSPNVAHRVNPVIHGKRAEVTVSLDPLLGARVEEYMYILHIELGDPIRPECADPVSLFILVTMIAALVLFAATRNVEPDY